MALTRTTIMASETLMNRVLTHTSKSGEKLTDFYNRAILNQLENDGDWTIRDVLEEENMKERGVEQLYKDLTGLAFGRLTAIRRIPDEKPSKWLCICSCGNTKIVRSSHLLSNSIRSCGCLHRDSVIFRNKTSHSKHNMTGTRLYNIWRGMKLRCYNTNEPDYQRYGGKGIRVCQEWLNSFETFRDWALSSGYCDDLTIDRIDNDKGYSPDNCRWSTNYEQTRNRGNTVFIEYRGHVKTLSEWSSITKIPYQVLWYRLFRAKNPWSVEEALENFSLEAEVNGCKED